MNPILPLDGIAARIFMPFAHYCNKEHAQSFSASGTSSQVHENTYSSSNKITYNNFTGESSKSSSYGNTYVTGYTFSQSGTKWSIERNTSVTGRTISGFTNTNKQSDSIAGSVDVRIGGGDTTYRRTNGYSYKAINCRYTAASNTQYNDKAIVFPDPDGDAGWVDVGVDGYGDEEHINSACTDTRIQIYNLWMSFIPLRMMTSGEGVSKYMATYTSEASSTSFDADGNSVSETFSSVIPKTSTRTCKVDVPCITTTEGAWPLMWQHGFIREYAWDGNFKRQYGWDYEAGGYYTHKYPVIPAENLFKYMGLQTELRTTNSRYSLLADKRELIKSDAPIVTDYYLVGTMVFGHPDGKTTFRPSGYKTTIRTSESANTMTYVSYGASGSFTTKTFHLVPTWVSDGIRQINPKQHTSIQNTTYVGTFRKFPDKDGNVGDYTPRVTIFTADDFKITENIQEEPPTPEWKTEGWTSWQFSFTNVYWMSVSNTNSIDIGGEKVEFPIRLSTTTVQFTNNFWSNADNMAYDAQSPVTDTMTTKYTAKTESSWTDGRTGEYKNGSTNRHSELGAKEDYVIINAYNVNAHGYDQERLERMNNIDVGVISRVLRGQLDTKIGFANAAGHFEPKDPENADLNQIGATSNIKNAAYPFELIGANLGRYPLTKLGGLQTRVGDAYIANFNGTSNKVYVGYSSNTSTNSTIQGTDKTEENIVAISSTGPLRQQYSGSIRSNAKLFYQRSTYKYVVSESLDNGATSGKKYWHAFSSRSNIEQAVFSRKENKFWEIKYTDDSIGRTTRDSEESAFIIDTPIQLGSTALQKKISQAIIADNQNKPLIEIAANERNEFCQDAPYDFIHNVNGSWHFYGNYNWENDHSNDLFALKKVNVIQNAMRGRNKINFNYRNYGYNQIARALAQQYIPNVLGGVNALGEADTYFLMGDYCSSTATIIEQDEDGITSAKQTIIPYEGVTYSNKTLCFLSANKHTYSLHTSTKTKHYMPWSPVSPAYFGYRWHDPVVFAVGNNGYVGDINWWNNRNSIALMGLYADDAVAANRGLYGLFGDYNTFNPIIVKGTGYAPTIDANISLENWGLPVGATSASRTQRDFYDNDGNPNGTGMISTIVVVTKKGEAPSKENTSGNEPEYVGLDEYIEDTIYKNHEDRVLIL
jgi:hypothetical protein